MSVWEWGLSRAYENYYLIFSIFEKSMSMVEEIEVMVLKLYSPTLSLLCAYLLSLTTLRRGVSSLKGS